MVCISGLMFGALMVAYEVGYGKLNPWVGMVVCLVMMVSAFRMIRQMKG